MSSTSTPDSSEGAAGEASVGFSSGNAAPMTPLDGGAGQGKASGGVTHDRNDRLAGLADMSVEGGEGGGGNGANGMDEGETGGMSMSSAPSSAPPSGTSTPTRMMDTEGGESTVPFEVASFSGRV